VGGGRFPASGIVPYIVAQVAGGIVGAAVLYLMPSGKSGLQRGGRLASNGYGEHSPGKYSMVAGLVSEVVMTFMFLVVILGTTHKRAPVGFAGSPSASALTLIHLVSIPVTNTSVNPARSTGPALFVGGWACSSSGCSGSPARRRGAGRRRVTAASSKREPEPAITGRPAATS
jgi:aquaporin Z